MNDNSYIKINKKTYDDVALDLEKRHQRVGVNEPTPDDYYKKITYYLGKDKDLDFLELGPGDGIILKKFSECGFNTTAIEISTNMIELSKKNSSKTHYINDDIKNVNFDGKQFDVIFAGSFIHLFPKDDLKIIMDKIFSWLKKDGVFFLYTTFHKKDEEGFFKKEKSNYSKENVRFRHNFTKESLCNLLTNHNFKIIEHYTIDEPENGRVWQFCICSK